MIRQEIRFEVAFNRRVRIYLIPKFGCDHSWTKCFFFRDPVFLLRNFLKWKRKFTNIAEEFCLKFPNFGPKKIRDPGS